MAEPLRNSFGAAIPKRIGAMLQAVDAAFDADAFVADALRGYEPLNLMQRGRHIAHALRRHLPDDYDAAIALLLASVDHAPARDGAPMGAFLFLPYTEFVSLHGLDHFATSMRALHALTQRFTGEFSVRPFIERFPELALAQLRAWASDPNEHVRRLVSEGTRPRLPWAARLRAFQRDPAPTLALLELLRDDPSLYVRRSVANHLNDIGKDHPEVLTAVARRWMVDAGEERQWIVRHALRSAVKRAEAGALEVLGFAHEARVAVEAVRIAPKRVAIGESVDIGFTLRNTGAAAQRVLVDYVVFYVKANGEARAKVFKLRTLDLAAGEAVRIAKRLSLEQRTTRTHYAGRHRVELLVNGRPMPLGEFVLVGS
ncbi:DNA alkylation repair protein [Chiayiivirga flava]|nr:DNA alkylation repair protein [Chiayiivirga flava]